MPRASSSKTFDTEKRNSVVLDHFPDNLLNVCRTHRPTFKLFALKLHAHCIYCSCIFSLFC